MRSGKCFGFSKVGINGTAFTIQAVCEWGRDSIESWGRKRRSVQNQTDEEKEEDNMTLSQEILVLDLGDEKQSDFLKSDPFSADFGKGIFQPFLRY